MYQVDEKDKVLELGDFPPMETGDPCPSVMSDQSRCVLGYGLRQNVDWNTTKVEEMEPQRVAVVQFNGYVSHIFGTPNEEVISGHPLRGRGLNQYGFFEVENSSWLRAMEKVNSVHERHDKEKFMSAFRHFIITFHDSTFECIARDYDISVFEPPVNVFDEMRKRVLITTYV